MPRKNPNADAKPKRKPKRKASARPDTTDKRKPKDTDPPASLVQRRRGSGRGGRGR